MIVSNPLRIGLPRRAGALSLALALALPVFAFAQLPLDRIAVNGGGTGTSAYLTAEPSQIMPAEGTSWRIQPLLTIGEVLDGYRPVGILDGTGAIALDAVTTRIFVNHELSSDRGYPYALANGTMLTGARVSYFDLETTNRALVAGGPAYDTVLDRYGIEVTSAAQINEGDASDEFEGFDRFCSANLYEAGEYNLVDTIFFTGEETGGGQECALDVENGVMYVAPALGRAAWESVCLLETGDPNTVAVLVGDDRQGAPLLLYLGQKDAIGDGSFLDRNGLAVGSLHVWVADDGSLSPQDWAGTFTSRTGTFVEIDIYQPDMAGMPGFDQAGWADQDTQDALAAAAGAFQFSRPEDVATDPRNGLRAVMASTGRGSAYPADNWGTTYLIDVALGETVTAELTIIYDGDDAGAGQFSDPDWGLRSPDNLDWADDGYIYLQEDRSTSPGSLFGGTSGMEASIWSLDPESGELTRIGLVDRAAVPTDQTDGDPDDIGDWETSGVLDVTSLFPTREGETLLLAVVQAHSLVGEPLGGANQAGDLVQGGQMVLMSATVRQNEDLRTTTDVAGSKPGTALAPAYPNPFNPQTTLSLRMDQAGPVSLRVFDAAGRLVRTLVSGNLAAGQHQVIWDGRTDGGGMAATGVYFARLETREGSQSQRMLLVK